MNNLALLSSLLISCAAVDGKPSPSDRVTSLDPSKLISSLSVKETRLLCEETSAYQERSVPSAGKLACSVKGTSEALTLHYKHLELKEKPSTETLRAACRQTYKACIANPEPSQKVSCQLSDTSEESSCPVTVAAFSDCIAEIAAVNEQLTRQDLCALITEDKPGAGFEKLTEVWMSAKCKPVIDGCIGPSKK